MKIKTGRLTMIFIFVKEKILLETVVLSESFDVGSGIRQDSLLSSSLFNVIMTNSLINYVIWGSVVLLRKFF